MRTLTLKKESIYDGTLLLVNAHHALGINHVTNLAPVDMHFPHIQLQRDAANILRLLLHAISAKSAIIPVSGYRSYMEQSAIYKDSLKYNGQTFTQKYVALPNHSEHQTGLAIDLGLNQKDIDFIRPNFPYEGICNEFRKIAPNYGFIERYGKYKEIVTGIAHEPWHFRYVGYPHSKIIANHNLSLEEYIEWIKKYCRYCRFIYHPHYGSKVEIFYEPAEEEQTILSIPETSLYHISGNNIDGFIVTLWS